MYEKVEGIKEKWPKSAKAAAYFKEVWDETFPDPDKVASNKFEKRRQMAKEAREQEEKMAAMTPEELEEYEKSIPEWKRSALVVTDDKVKDEDTGRFAGLKNRIRQSESYQ